jgi:hypothetical protein
MNPIMIETVTSSLCSRNVRISSSSERVYEDKQYIIFLIMIELIVKVYLSVNSRKMALLRRIEPTTVLVVMKFHR